MRNKKIYPYYIKPVGDFILSIIGLVVLSPIFIIVILIIALKDGFPVIFKQERVGKHGKIFKIYKFRTMVKNADKIGGTSTVKGDPRITKIGSILRKTSLDELPQILNITKGNMSIIGYRPDVYRDDKDYGLEMYKYKPGITGVAQVNGRSSISVEEKRYLENYYAENISFNLDVKIILKTIGIVCFSKGAY